MTIHYDKLMQQLHELYTNKRISIDPNDINPQLNIILRSFAFIADNVSNQLASSYEYMRKDIIKSLYPYIFNIIPSIAIVAPSMEFSAFTIPIHPDNKVFVFHKNKKYTYSVPYACNLYDIAFTNFQALAYNDMQAYLLNPPRFFLSFDLTSNNFLLDETTNIETIIYIQASNLDMLSITNGSKRVFLVENSQLIEVGSLELFDDFEILESIRFMPKHIAKSMSYFILPALFDIFKLKLDLSRVVGQRIKLYLAIDQFFGATNISFLVNPIVLTNQFVQESEHYDLVPNNKHLVYVDYESKSDILLRTIGNVYCIDNNKQITLINSAQGVPSYAEQNINPHLVYRRYDNEDIYDYKVYIEIIATHEIDFTGYQFFVDGSCTNYVDAQISFVNVVFSDQGAITSVKALSSNTYTFLNNSLLHVYEHLFFVNSMNFLNVEDKTSVLVHIIKCLYDVCGRHKYLYDLIKSVQLVNAYDNVIFHGKYLANLSILSIDIAISTKYIDTIPEGMMRAISYLVYGLVGFDKRVSIQFVSEDKKSTLACYKYIRDEEEYILS